MGSCTWKCNINVSDSSNAGTNWGNIYTLSYSSGTLPPTGSTINSVSYSYNARIGSYSTSKKWQFYAIAISNGPYTTTPYTSSSATSLTHNETMYNNTWYYSGNFTNTGTTSALFGYTLYVKLRANSTATGTTYIRDNGTSPAISVTVNYTDPVVISVSDPSDLRVNGSTSYSGTTAPLTWTASTVTGGSGTITYRIIIGSDQFTTESTSYTIPQSTCQNYTSQVTIMVDSYVTISGERTYCPGYSNNVYFTYSPPEPSITTPGNFAISNTTGISFTLTWTASTLTNLSGTITYYIYDSNGTNINNTTNLSYTVAESVAKNYTTQTGFRIRAGCNDTYSGYTAYKYFTYISPNKTVGYYNGSSWINCLPYYYNGSEWIKCEAYYYNGSQWIPVNTK